MNSTDEVLAQVLLAGADNMPMSASGAVVLEQFRRREPLHAYLISGAKGLGKATFAKVLVCTLFCEAGAQGPCGICAGCKSVLNAQNPDVLTVEPEGSKQVGVERIREVISAISQHAFGTGYRVVVIEPVEKLTPQAQNCLLKSLEEPVSNVVFLLLAHELTAILGTIASRCARVKLAPWADEAMISALDAHGYGQAEIHGVLPVVSGNIGQALEMLAEQEESKDINVFLQKALDVRSDMDVVSLSTGLKENRENAERYVNAIEQAVHTALLVRTGQLDANALKDVPESWKALVPVVPVESFTKLMMAVFEARRLRLGQVNWQSNIDHLLIKILEERRKWQQLSA